MIMPTATEHWQSHRRDVSHVVLLRVPRRHLPLYTQRLYIWSSVVCTHSGRKIYFPTNSPPRLLPGYFNFGGHEYRGQGTSDHGMRLRAVSRPRRDSHPIYGIRPSPSHIWLTRSGLRPGFSEFPPRPFSHLAYPVRIAAHGFRNFHQGPSHTWLTRSGW
jgi:hypothetical protein